MSYAVMISLQLRNVMDVGAYFRTGLSIMLWQLSQIWLYRL
jgi:hypothetical protein